MPQNKSQGSARRRWSDDELAAAVDAYMEMARRLRSGAPCSKADVYRDLAARFGRTESAFEYRMQNISAVLAEQGQRWIDGLPPATNVGERVKLRLVSLLALRPEETPARLASGDYKTKIPAMRDWLIGIARGKGSVFYADVMRIFGLKSFQLLHALRRLGQSSRRLGEPIITALIVNDETGRCSDGFQKEFGIADDAAERARLYQFWGDPSARVAETPPASLLEQRAAVFSRVELRPDQAAFRRAVFLACHGRCVISGCDIPRALDAAHRVGRDWRLGHNSSDDGYLLRKDLHALHDAGLLEISSDGTVRLEPAVARHYPHFDGIGVGSGGIGVADPTPWAGGG